MPPIEFIFFRTGADNEPVRAWLWEVSSEARKIIGADLRTIQRRWPLGMPLVRKMGNDLWEARSTIPEGIARVLFTVDEQALIALHGFVKKSAKTPAHELATAEKRLAEYRRNKP